MAEMHATDAHDEASSSCSGRPPKRPRTTLSSPPLDPAEVKDIFSRTIFCNRPLNMKQIVAVGFDMDYTLAQYKRDTFESLAYNSAVQKLVNELDYPNELLGWKFNPDYIMRGLVLDKKRGNTLKMDRHKYVKVAYHGFKEMKKEERIATYGNTLVRESFDGPDYAVIDTLFSLAEAYLFVQLVTLKDNFRGKIRQDIDYARMYQDVRNAIDLCHRDGKLKNAVAQDPPRFIINDAEIMPMLKMIRDSGRATFLVTNSLWDYTNIVMNFLNGSSPVNDDGSINIGWLQYFDVVITGSEKPGFFVDKRAIFEVVPETGMLLNTDNGDPMPKVGYILPRVEDSRPRKVFQGGSVAHLHKLLRIESSSQVLYVGDHIYGDILRSKKALGWRTMLVIPELDDELESLWESRNLREEIQKKRIERAQKEHESHSLEELISDNPDDGTKEVLERKADELKLEIEQVRSSHKELRQKLHGKFHKTWGQLMKAGNLNSRFAHQVETFACLYTSRVTNLGYYACDHYYRPSEDYMNHDHTVRIQL